YPLPREARGSKLRAFPVLGDPCERASPLAARASARGEQGDAEAPLAVEPARLQPQRSRCRQLRELALGVLDRVFGLDEVAAREAEAAAERGDPHVAVAPAHEADLDATAVVDDARAVAPIAEFERAAQLAVDPREQVLVEARGDALRVVVRAPERLRVLAQV